MKIINQKHGTLNAADRLQLANLLTKAGYFVHLSQDKQGEGTKVKSVPCVEYWESKELSL